MKLEHYQALTSQLEKILNSRADVLGLIALGSMAGTERQPDEQSDHDFFVITESDKQQHYRDTIDWLPYSERVVLHFQETDHGCKAIYDDGHILEYAIFDLDELQVARINSYRIIFDKATLIDIMPSIQVTISSTFDAQRTFDAMISNILVGAMRAKRGESMSAHAFIKHHALYSFMTLCWHQLSDNSRHQDSLDSFRRFEQQFSEIGAQLQAIMKQSLLESAINLLKLSETHLSATLPDSRTSAIQVIRDYITFLSS